MKTERGGIGALLFLAAVVFFLMKISESPGPRTASAVGSYTATEEVKNAAREIAKDLQRYQAPAPYKCSTTSWDGPYKHDGRTYSTVCN